VLLATSTRGGTASQRQQLKRDKALLDAGLALREGSRLFRHGASGRASRVPADSGSDSDDDSGGSEDVGRRCASDAAERDAAAAAAGRSAAAVEARVSDAHAAADERMDHDSDSSESGSGGAGAAARPARDLSAAQPPVVAMAFGAKRKAPSRGPLTQEGHAALDEGADAAPARPARDLSAAQPPVAVTFGRSKRTGAAAQTSRPDSVEAAAAEPGTGVSRDEQERAQAAMAALVSSGEVTGADFTHPGLCASHAFCTCGHKWTEESA
jgi:hypothetical protein